MSMTAVLAFALPTKSLTNVQAISSADLASVNKTITLAATPEHLFTHDGHIHGFGYDAANRYANHINANLIVKSYKSEEEVVAAIKRGEADIMLSHRSYGATDGLASTIVNCSSNILPNNLDLNTNTNFVFRSSNIALINGSKDYLCDPQNAADTNTIAQFYRTNALDSYSIMHFERAIKNNLPLYKGNFKTAAKQYKHDWELLVAISYQESHLDPEATSFTGVQGLMMLTNDTAEAMGVTDRTDAAQSIQGGAKYLAQLKKRFSDIPESERLWFVLAAYNMGPNAVRNIQAEIDKTGKNSKLWSNFYSHLANNAKKNSRFTQCMHYVTNIRTYFESLKSA